MPLRWLLVLIAAGVATSVSGDNRVADDCRSATTFPPRCVEHIKTLKGDIAHLISRSACTDSAQCRTVGLGARLCGGPAVYVAYSQLGADERRLLERVREYNRLTRTQLEYLSRVHGVGAECTVVVDPGAVCLSGQCVLRGGAAGPTAR